ncbi:hypothetical protein NIES21_26940 [Anabaenopsis circularis NIES-21]|uniref:Uncharacterized protein n=1 Tax=Anabaenopsis circularis NIES-21 TaxID=1085406 RepID=A0A1Z4GH87_9CYAN|nr:hypothetical protein NIES21_26940 [Anabaenopsis circularis NIES-21]
MILLPAYRENRQSHCYLCAEYSVSSLPILMIFIANHLDKSCLRGNETALPLKRGEFECLLLIAAKGGFVNI